MSLIHKIIYRLYQQIASTSIGIYKIKYEGNKRFYWNEPKKEWIGPFAETDFWEPVPVFTIEHEFMQQFVDEVKDMGFSPSSLASFQGELMATKEHLKDMRTLVFKEANQ